MKHYTIPVFIPELACPFQCVFCNQEKITGRQLVPTDEQIRHTVETHLAGFREKERTVEIGFFGGSFTGLPPEEQAHFLSVVRPYLESGEVSAIRCSTRPDYINPEVLSLLKDGGVRCIELGAQSLDDEVLRQSFRGHTAARTAQAAHSIRQAGFRLGLQMMIGLPGDSLARALATARKIIELGAHSTRIYPALVIRGTAMHRWYEAGRYRPLSLEEAVHWTKQLLPLFENAGVRVLRVGLHPSEGLLTGDELVAGPFHPSFRELVLTEIWNDRLQPLLQLKKEGEIHIQVPEGAVNNAIGYNGKNKKMLLKKFRKVSFSENPGLSGRREFTYRIGD